MADLPKKKITVAHGDGIGPEIMKATLKILNAAEVPLEYDEIQVGEKVYLSGITSGISPDDWETLRRNKVFLKAPITTPQGGGYKSLNVTIRKSLGLFANVRPCMTLTPYIESHFDDMDLVIVRENEEDLYAGIEHQQTSEVIQCLKLISRPGCEKIVRYAFEYARVNNRKKVTCMTKDNIMKHTDGLFHSVFNEIAVEYPDIENEHYIIDIGSARIADRPNAFDVIVTLNLYGDIISDIAAEVAGSVGFSGSANIGQDFGMFEAIHGSAPDIAGQGIANPAGLLNGACMMLVHLGMSQKAEMIQNALLTTIEDGIHTGDIANETTTKKVGTQEFADAIIERLGKKPTKLTPVQLNHEVEGIEIGITPYKTQKKELVGVDAFVDWIGTDRNPDTIGGMLEAACPDSMKLKMITNRGVKVYPNGIPETFCTDHWRCRFVNKDFVKGKNENAAVSHEDIIALLTALNKNGIDAIKTENLYLFDGKRGYSLGQGE
ncbi:MAG: isocitrate dehydrogenase [Spirosomataceae bacterium]|jgi:isocitrate dehydrogenase